MNREQTQMLLARLIERIASNTQDEAGEMLQEDVADFLSPARFARERQQFFLDSPQVIGFAGEVKDPGSFMTADVMGVPVVVTRDHDHQLHAMVNACAHRGARVAHGCGNKTRLTCKFHGWSYQHNGQLHARPQDKAFDQPDHHCHLKKLPVSDRSGLVVVGINPAMSQATVDNHLADIEAQFSGFAFGQMHTLETRRFEVNANWKLIAALSYESYHFATLHRDSVAQWLKPNCVHDFFGRHSRWSFAMKGTEKLQKKDRSEWPATIPGAVSHALFPGTVVITNPEDAQIIRTEPGNTPDTSVVYYSGVCRYPENMEASRAAYDFGGKAFEHEDLPAAIECQQGLTRGREKIVIGRNEPVVQFWHRMWREQLQG
ncbi:MAG TPA: aromatic ring-hydroxylating dioxygenase subunit alpha [Pseudomonadales bacterium]|nr:aromatic ring-hydroxylating dioxygenase subunit alpha [Pseudomonadales bacterium]